MTWLYPGSFDPPHSGHCDVIRRAAKLAAQLIVAVAAHPHKTPFLPVATRVALLRASCADLGNVEVAHYSGATLAFARARGVTALVRGVRSANDLDHEAPMAAVHRAHGLETMVLLASPEHLLLSSRMLRDMHAAGLDVADWVPPGVASAMQAARSTIR